MASLSARVQEQLKVAFPALAARVAFGDSGEMNDTYNCHGGIHLTGVR